MRSNLIKAMLLASVCAVGLSACETMDSAWNDITGEETPYAGDVRPQQPPMAPNQMTMQQQPMQPMAMQQTTTQQTTTMQPMQPMMAQQPVVPQAAMQPTMMPQQAQMQPVASPAMQPGYQPNLASVPARPMASELPQPQQVQEARQQLANDNQMMTGYLRDPRGGNYQTAQAASAQPVPPLSPNQDMTAAYQPPAMPQAPAQNPTQTFVQQQPGQSPAMTSAAATQQASNLIEGQLLGLQATGTGQYALTPLGPEAPLGGFALASTLQYAPNSNQITMPQYQQLKTVAGQYASQPGRVRVVSYGDAANSRALQNATTAAAYLVDMGVPANAIRVKIDDASAAADPMVQSKTDIFLETPAQR